MIKKLSAFILALLLVFCIPVNAMALNVTITQPGESEKGEEIIFEVRLSEGITVKSGSVQVVYDPNYLTFVSAQWHITGAMVTIYNPADGLGAFAYMAPTQISGLIFTATFKVKDDADYGDASVDINTVFSASGSPAQDGQSFPVEGDVYVSCMNHIPDAPITCIQDQHCSVCQMVLPAAPHTFGAAFGGDETHHWQVCEVSGCGAINEVSKAEHISTGANVATCNTQAICDVCNVAYGTVDPSNHAGGTTIVNAAEPNHQMQQDGYTGDTQCLGCGAILAGGQIIAPGDHVPASVWSNDATHHWKECNIVGCGVMIDGSKAEHTSTGANVATCLQPAVCDVCGVAYGTVAPHTFTAEEKTAQALKIAGNCRDNAVYYYSCALCGVVENNDNHTFLGDKVAADHVGGTTLVNVSEAVHNTQQNGYTGDTKCLGCNQIIANGQSIIPTPHEASATWVTDGTNHWKVCTVDGCGTVIAGSVSGHSSTGANAATCQAQAICDVCGVSYGTVAAHNFSATLSMDATGHWYACQTTGCTEKSGYVAHTPDHEGGASEDYAVKCTVCQYVIYEQLEHVHAFDKEVAIDAYKASEATCTAAATYYKSCRCGLAGTETFSSGEFAPHTWMDATCTAPKTCEACGATEGVENGHTAGGAWQSDATYHWRNCTAAGCGVVVLDSKAEHTPDHEGGASEDYAVKCTVCMYVIHEQLEHVHIFDKEVAIDAYKASEATCTAAATYYKSCRCGQKSTETFSYGEAAPHTWEDATCTAPKTCEVCGATEGIENGHTVGGAWQSDATYHWMNCTVVGCGVVVLDTKAEHTPDHEGGASEDYAVKCTVCMYVIHEQLEHVHIFDKEVAIDAYKASDATCTAAATYYKSCRCGQKSVETFSYGEVAPHAWKDATCAAPKTCETCGIKEGTRIDHNDADKNGVCDYCKISMTTPPPAGDGDVLLVAPALLVISLMGLGVALCNKKRLIG